MISNSSASVGSVASASATSPATFASSLWAGKKYDSRARRVIPGSPGSAAAGCGPGSALARPVEGQDPQHVRRDRRADGVDLEAPDQRRQLAVAVPDQVDGMGRQVQVDHVGELQEVAVDTGPIIDDRDVGPAAVDDRGIPERCRVAPPGHDDGVRLQDGQDLVGPALGRAVAGSVDGPGAAREGTRRRRQEEGRQQRARPPAAAR